MMCFAIRFATLAPLWLPAQNKNSNSGELLKVLNVLESFKNLLSNKSVSCCLYNSNRESFPDSLTNVSSLNKSVCRLCRYNCVQLLLPKTFVKHFAHAFGISSGFRFVGNIRNIAEVGNSIQVSSALKLATLLIVAH